MSSGFTYNKFRPKSRTQAQIWNKLNSEKSWDGIPIRFWPISLAKAVCEEKLDYRTRWHLMLYLVGNGWIPEEAADEVLKMGASYFDGDAKRHVANLARDMYTKGHEWTYWDEDHGQRMKIGNIRGRRVGNTRKSAPIKDWMPKPPKGGYTTPFGQQMWSNMQYNMLRFKATALDWQ